MLDSDILLIVLILSKQDALRMVQSSWDGLEHAGDCNSATKPTNTMGGRGWD